MKKTPTRLSVTSEPNVGGTSNDNTMMPDDRWRGEFVADVNDVMYVTFTNLTPGLADHQHTSE